MNVFQHENMLLVVLKHIPIACCSETHIVLLFKYIQHRELIEFKHVINSINAGAQTLAVIMLSRSQDDIEHYTFNFTTTTTIPNLGITTHLVGVCNYFKLWNPG